MLFRYVNDVLVAQFLPPLPPCKWFLSDSCSVGFSLPWNCFSFWHLGAAEHHRCYQPTMLWTAAFQYGTIWHQPSYRNVVGKIYWNALDMTYAYDNVKYGHTSRLRGARRVYGKPSTGRWPVLALWLAATNFPHNSQHPRASHFYWQWIGSDFMFLKCKIWQCSNPPLM